MFEVENLKKHYRCKSKADDEFRSTMELLNDMLQFEKNVYLKFPVDINENNHHATWDYMSMLTEDETDDYDDEEEPYLFNDIYVGIHVTTKMTCVFGGDANINSYLTTYIGGYGCEEKVNLYNYDLSNELNMAIITNDTAAVVATLRDLEMFISKMESKRGEILLDLLSKLFDC
jgi:hypothetical protein